LFGGKQEAITYHCDILKLETMEDKAGEDYHAQGYKATGRIDSRTAAPLKK
jgi:hypothetical protein